MGQFNTHDPTFSEENKEDNRENQLQVRHNLDESISNKHWRTDL